MVSGQKKSGHIYMHDTPCHDFKPAKTLLLCLLLGQQGQQPLRGSSVGRAAAPAAKQSFALPAALRSAKRSMCWPEIFAVVHCQSRASISSGGASMASGLFSCLTPVHRQVSVAGLMGMCAEVTPKMPRWMPADELVSNTTACSHLHEPAWLGHDKCMPWHPLLWLCMDCADFGRHSSVRTDYAREDLQALRPLLSRSSTATEQGVMDRPQSLIPLPGKANLMCN